MDKLIDKNVFFELNNRISDKEFKDFRLLGVVKNGKTCIYVTNEDKVYGFGRNHLGCLGLGSEQQYIHSPQLNTTLSDKQLIEICFGWDHCIGLTRSGQCYAWGGNRFGQLGNGLKKRKISSTPLLIESLAKKRVAQISCGKDYNLALTDLGQVYGWGQNDLGQCGQRIDTKFIPKPTLINIAGQVKALSCGKTHSIAVMANGLVYVWGNNRFGQLGRKLRMNDEMSSRPLVVDTLVNEVIVKAVCGSHHTLLLSAAGDVYTFGRNNWGQIGNGSSENQIIPFRVNVGVKFTDIASSFESDSSVGQSGPNGYYIWGSAWNSSSRERRKEWKPIRVCPKIQRSLFDIFAKCSHLMTFRTVVVRNELQSHSDNRSKGLNKSIEDNLRIASMASNDKQILSKSSSDLSNTEVYNDSDIYESSDESNETSIQTNVSESSRQLSEASILTKIIDTKNVCLLYAKAIDKNIPELEKYCIEFVAKNEKQICLTQEFRDMNDSLAKDLIIGANKMKI